MPSLPRISVVIPSLNQAEFIEDTLLSVLGQGYPDLEVIVMDGGSSDGTVAILEKFSERLAYWQSEKDEGQADAINKGMERATGDVFCWLNSDDAYLPGTLSKVARAMEEHIREPWLVHGAALLLREEDGAVRSYAKESMAFDRNRLTHEDYINQSSAFWTRTLWERTGPLRADYRFVFDWDWFIRSSKNCAFEYLPKLLSVYRLHENQKSGASDEKRRREILSVVQTHGDPYWSNLFQAVDSHFGHLTGAAERLRVWKIPKRKFLLPLFLPKLWGTLKRADDLETALVMLSEVRN